ncbi:hypothetical protein QUF75_00985 [Desulfococcaceae bacterium HSG7]|nr:hypothetical protein [Desulfococcaceae bacterium HSG7]
MTIPYKHFFKRLQPPAGHPIARMLLLVILATLIAGCGTAIHELKSPVAVPAQFSAPELHHYPTDGG